MKTTETEFESLLKKDEGVNLEFKSAKNTFNEDSTLPDYCAALCNEGGGKLILGIDNKKNIVGTQVFKGNVNKLSHQLYSKLGIRVDVEELTIKSKRILIFHIPSRFTGQPIRSTGKYRYPMRAGESLVEMDQATLKRILNETEPDFSNLIIPGLTVKDLNKEALIKLKKLWSIKASRPDYLQISDIQMLKNLSLLSDKGLNYACLITLGTDYALSQHLPDAEIIFEWRQDPTKITHDFRKSWREPFFLIYDDIWNTINARNTRIPFQDGFIQKEVLAFDEKSIREAFLNAVTHRDYTVKGSSIFIRATTDDFNIESPGGFVPGIDTNNILYRTSWRNRRLAETFEKAGLVERSGQGVNDIFEKTIRDGKGLPDFSTTDNYFVRLRIPAKVKDKDFLVFLEKISSEKHISFTFDEIFELEKIREHQKLSNIQYEEKFLDAGIIEKVGSGRGKYYMLSHRYYAHEGKLGEYTRLKGISREQKKELILAHIKKNKKGYMKEFKDAFPDLKPKDITNILQELRKDKKISFSGNPKGYWLLTPSKD